MEKDPRGDGRSPHTPEMIGELRDGDRGSGAKGKLKKQTGSPGSIG